MAGGRHLRTSATRRQRFTPVLVVAVVGLLGVAFAAIIVDLGADDAAVRSEIGDQAAPSVPISAPATAPPTSTTSTTVRGPRGSGAPITIAIAGDSYAEGVLATRLATSPADFIGPFAPVFRDADLAILNLETAITERGEATPGKQFTFRAPPSVLDALSAGGIDVVSMANNHGMDFGDVGLADSLAAKRSSKVMIVGIGGDEDEAYAPAIVEVKGQRVAVIGATQVLDDRLIPAWTATPTQGGLASAKRVERLVAEVAAIRDSVDTIVVLLHWGIETQECPSAVQQQLAVTLEAAGADLLVGGHAHRVQGGGMLGSAAVHYGLGNFLFKENNAPGARTGVFVVTVAGQEIDDVEWIPGRVRASVPEPLQGTAAADELARWNGQRACTNLTSR